jgi:hypothetical protein
MQRKPFAVPQDRAHIGGQTYDGSRDEGMGSTEWSTCASRDAASTSTRSGRFHFVLRFALVKGASLALLDISAQFLFPPVRTPGNFSYKEASGELGVPGRVATHRLESAQRTMSARTGEHAGHMIGIQFGAPADARNLGLQNPNIYTFAPKALQLAFQGHGGSYHDLESRWTPRLKEGYRIRVTVRDKYRKGENRPFSRWAQWTETKLGASSGQR